MTAQLLDGRSLAADIRTQIKQEIKTLGITPGLAALLVGSDPASHLYVNLKEKACHEVGIHFEKYLFFATEPQDKIIAKIEELNKRSDIHGILVQLPLPSQFHEDVVIRAINPQKDVDGFHPQNLQALTEGHPTVIPGVALGIFELIKAAHQPLPGKRAVLLVNSNTFALPIAHLLEKSGMHVTTVVAPADLESISPKLASADILISAIGRPHAITEEMIKSNNLVIDVGTNRLPDGTLAGDIHPAANQKAGFITPVPGGVGPMTVAMLLKNVVELAKLH